MSEAFISRPTKAVKIVQQTGESEKEVMSQKSTTELVAAPGTLPSQNQIVIGGDNPEKLTLTGNSTVIASTILSNSNIDASVIIGATANTTNNSVIIGPGSSATDAAMTWGGGKNVVIGTGCQSNGNGYNVSIGEDAKTDSESVYSVAIGAGAYDNSNAGVVIGSSNKIDPIIPNPEFNAASVAIGNGAWCLERGTIVIGENNNAGGMGKNIILGRHSDIYANALSSIAIGDHVNVYNNVTNSVGIGTNTSVYGSNNVVLGANSSDGDNTSSMAVYVGNKTSNITRQIKQVTDPTDDQDAATKKYVDDKKLIPEQTTGQQTDKVMSQKATTDMIKDPVATVTNGRVKINSKMTVDNNGYTGLLIHTGSSTNTCGNACVIVGGDVTVSSSTTQGVTAVGWNSKCNNSATAIGDGANSSGVSAVSLGGGAVAFGRESLALGRSTEATAESSVAIGYMSKAPLINTVSFGSGTDSYSPKTRRLVNVTDPVNAQDVTTKAYVDDEISKIDIDIPVANKGTMPTTGIDLAALNVSNKQWIRKIVFNETITIPASVTLRLKNKHLSGTYSINFTSSYIAMYNTSGSYVCQPYSSNNFISSFTTPENISWDLPTRTLSFDNCVYQFTVDEAVIGDITQLSDVGKVYLDSTNGETGTLQPIDIRQAETTFSLSPFEGQSDLIGMTQKTVTSNLKALRDTDLSMQDSMVSNRLLNFTNWDLIMLTNNIAARQAVRYSNGTTWFGKMALEFDGNTKSIVLKVKYKQQSVGAETFTSFTFDNLKNNSSNPEFLLCTTTTNYLIIDTKDGKVYRGEIGIIGVPSSKINQIATLPIVPSTYQYAYRTNVVNGIIYVYKADTNGGTHTPLASTDNGATWESVKVSISNMATSRVYSIRYVNNMYYMTIMTFISSSEYAILTSSDGINFTNINATNPNIYDLIYDNTNSIWYGRSTSGWVSGVDVGNMTSVGGFTMNGDYLCRFSTSYPLGVLGMSTNSNNLSNIFVTRDCLTSTDSLQTFPTINNNSFYMYNPQDASSINSNITCLLRINGVYFLGELQSYTGVVSPSVRIPPQFCLPSFSSSGTFTLKVVNGVIQWVSG